MAGRGGAGVSTVEIMPTLGPWGVRPDGSPWLMGVDFGRFVTLDAYGRIGEHRLSRTPSLEEWDEKARGLLAAVDWIRSGRTAELEAERAKEQQP
jgi:hypothetical protein